MTLIALLHLDLDGNERTFRDCVCVTPTSGKSGSEQFKSITVNAVWLTTVSFECSPFPIHRSLWWCRLWKAFSLQATNTKLLVQAYGGGAKTTPWEVHVLPPKSWGMGAVLSHCPPPPNLFPPLVAHPNLCHFPTPRQLSWAGAVAWTVFKSFVLPSASVLSYLSSLFQVIHQQIDFCSSQECLKHNLHCHDLTKLSPDSAKMFWGKKMGWFFKMHFFTLLAILTGFSAMLGVLLHAQWLITPSTERLLQ